ncbi:VCBS repeat-containing protein [candidate division WOR-3 bacterium]|nr:VCBS repeat-containing protein [candidate division WOR-3 bacterium]
MKRCFSFAVLLFVFVECCCLNYYAEHIIQSGLGWPWFVWACDIDSDGDIDIAGTDRIGNSLDWYENGGNQYFTRHNISSSATGVMKLEICDLDCDGDSDIVCAVDEAALVLWYENDGSQNFTPNVVSNWSGVTYVRAVDLDIDGDIDILAAACENADRFGWFENDGSMNFTDHTVKYPWDNANSIASGDLDGDGDNDLFGTASIAGDLSWFENDGSMNFTEHQIETSWGRPNHVEVIDMDGDGDSDLVASSCIIGQVAWYENDGSTNLTKHLIDSAGNSPHTVVPVDFDGDGDIDVIGADLIADKITYWENTGQIIFTGHTVARNVNGSSDVFVSDVDQDGDLDIVSSIRDAFYVAWYETVTTFLFADFMAEPQTGHEPLTVHFTDSSFSSPAANDWSWDFESDGTFDSHDQNPVHVYGDSGDYTVTLVVSNDSLTDTIIKQKCVRVFNGESALGFDGASSRAVCQSSPNLDLTDSLSIEAWIYPHGWGENSMLGFGRIIDKVNLSFYLVKSGASYNDHCLAVKIVHSDNSTSYSFTPDSSIILDTWQHIAFTYLASSSELKIYINGVEQPLTYLTSPSGSVKDHSSYNLYVGNNNGLNFTFNGVIDDLRIWNSCLTQQTIQSNLSHPLSGSESGLVAYWNMNEANGDTLFDGTANMINCRIFNCEWVQGTPFYSTHVEEINADHVKTVSFQLSASVSASLVEIRLEIFKDSPLVLEIYDLVGRKIKILADKEISAGQHEFFWNTSEEPAGQYFLLLRTGNFSKTCKITLVR